MKHYFKQSNDLESQLEVDSWTSGWIVLAWKILIKEFVGKIEDNKIIKWKMLYIKPYPVSWCFSFIFWKDLCLGLMLSFDDKLPIDEERYKRPNEEKYE